MLLLSLNQKNNNNNIMVTQSLYSPAFSEISSYEVRDSPRSCLWSEERSCHCWLCPWTEPQLSVVLACCCFQATLRSYSHSIPSPVLQSASLRGICSRVRKLVPEIGRSTPGSHLFIEPIRIIKKSGDETGSGHRGNKKIAGWWGVRSS